MIEAVIWDFGGVFTSSPFEAFARFEVERGAGGYHPAHERPQPLGECLGEVRTCRGRSRDFRRAVPGRVAGPGRGGARQDVLPLLSGDLRPEMVDALRIIKSRFKTGCITNNLPANAIGSASGRSLYIAEVMALFDHIIESAKIGLRKPDPQIYRMMADTLGVDPVNCIYLDDLGVNLKPAREMGMRPSRSSIRRKPLRSLKRRQGFRFKTHP